MNSEIRDEAFVFFPKKSIQNRSYKDMMKKVGGNDDTSSIRSIECELTDDGSRCESQIDDAIVRYNSIRYKFKL